MNTEPLSNYIKSIGAQKAGDTREAERLLAASLGITELTPFLKENLAKVTDIGQPNEAVLVLLLNEASKREN